MRLATGNRKGGDVEAEDRRKLREDVILEIVKRNPGISKDAITNLMYFLQQDIPELNYRFRTWR